MVIHKKTRLTPFQRQEVYKSYYENQKKVSGLAEEYHVSRPTIYKILRRGRHKDFTIHRSTNKRFLNFYNGVRPHKGIDGLTPEEKLIEYFYPEKL